MQIVKNMMKLMVVGLLMQHGVAQASWTYEELFGAKQARVVKYAGGAKRALFRDDNVIGDSNVINHYHALREGAEYLEKRKNVIKPWATLGLACLCYQESDCEKNDKDFYNSLDKNLSDEMIVQLNQKKLTPNGYVRPLLGYTGTFENITWQFNREQRVYQNRVVAATGVVLVSAVAGYLLANKK